METHRLIALLLPLLLPSILRGEPEQHSEWTIAHGDIEHDWSAKGSVGSNATSGTITDPISTQIRALDDAKNNCEQLNVTRNELISEEVRREDYCPSVWDGALCWPESPPNTIVRQPCPTYVTGFQNRTAYKNCTADGQWYFNKSTNSYWTDFRECMPTRTVHGFNPLSLDARLKILMPHIPNFRLISRVGYSISLISLLLAFFILVYVKYICRRLRCPRNSLHLQLFISFMIRSSIFLAKQFTTYGSIEHHSVEAEHSLAAFAEKTDQNLMALSNNFDGGFLEDNWNYTFLPTVFSTISCKVFTAVWQYSLLANYNWILMEGLYLHNVIFFNIFNDNSNILSYICLGWGLPIPIVLAWALMRSIYEDTYCWITNTNVKIFWIMRAPITISIVMNFFFFINIIRVLFLKMFARSAANYAQKYKYRTWFRSTLVLMPLFGVHYMIFLAFTTLTFNSYDIFEILWLYTDLSFTTFQGCLVALLYCFLNNEVQIELRKIWSLCKQNIASKQLLRHNSATTQHPPASYSRTRHSFMSNIDCNSFFKKEENISRSSETNPAVIAAVDKAVAYHAYNGGHVIITTNNHACHHGQINDNNGHVRVEPGVQLGETII